jgi:hypothetical protein
MVFQVIVKICMIELIFLLLNFERKTKSEIQIKNAKKENKKERRTH